MCIYTLDIFLADKMRMSESNQNSAARLLVNLILQNKTFETVEIYCKKCAITNL